MIKDATFLAEQIKKRKISPIELMNDFQNKASHHSELNAFVSLDKDKAVDYLSNVPEHIKEQPFYGVPFPLKDLGQTKKGWIQTSGSRLFKHAKAMETNNYVKKIEQAGFIPFGITTTPEFGFKNVTDPVIYGPAKNPWNSDYYSGGSSGGAASVVASGISPIAGASDGGGSIRIPASFSSLIGLKPSRGTIVTGPSSWRDWQGASVNFVLGVSMRDTQAMLNLLQPDTQISPFLKPKELNKDYSKPFKIAVCIDSPVGNPTSSDAKEAVLQTCRLLENLGHQIDIVNYPVDGKRLIRSYYQMNGGETANMMNEIANSLQREITMNDMELMSWTMYQYGTRLSAADYVNSFGEWDEATKKMEMLFQTYDLFLSPTATTVAPKIEDDLQSDVIRKNMSKSEYLNKNELSNLVYDMFEKSLWITPYTQLANLTGQPAISLPTYLTENNMPIGVQLMAAKGQDNLLIEIGKQIEESNGFKLPVFYQ